MSEFTPLRRAADTLADRAAVPHLDDLERRAVRRGRRRAARVGAAIVAVIAGTAIAFAGADREAGPAPADRPQLERSAAPDTERSGPLPPMSPERFEMEVRATLARASGWVVLDSDPWLLPGACEGDWAESGGFGGGSFSVATSERPASVWADKLHFPTARRAAAAVNGLPDYFAPCAETWQTAPVAQTGAVLAYSDEGVVFVQRQGSSVATLQIPTADGPPSADVQAEIVELLEAYARHE